MTLVYGSRWREAAVHPWPPIGENIARLRALADLTQEELAEKADVSVDLIRRLEQSSRLSARIASLYHIANALDVPLSVLLAQPNVLRPSERDGEQGGVLAVRQALTPTKNGIARTDEAPEALSAAELQRSAQEGWRLYNSGKFSMLAALLPELISAGELATQQLTGQQRAEAFAALVDFYQVAALLVTQLAHDDLGFIAAQKAIAAADHADDPNLRAAVFVTLSWVLLRQGRLAEAEQVALDTANDSEPSFAKATPVELSVWGVLLGSGMWAASRNEKHAQAADLLSLIQAAAHRVGEDRYAYSWPFGPTQAAISAVALAVDRGDSGRALQLVQQVPKTGKVPLRTTARYLLDVALAQCLENKNADALTTLREVRELAPEWMRYQVLAREITRALLTKQGATRSRLPGLRELATFLGVAD
ncbi:MAG: helix-turn-helix domain-containing protein, partial [Egibacteraceae bacterium]